MVGVEHRDISGAFNPLNTFKLCESYGRLRDDSDPVYIRFDGERRG